MLPLQGLKFRRDKIDLKTDQSRVRLGIKLRSNTESRHYIDI